MKKYISGGNTSGITAYESGFNFIKVEFKHRIIYEYNYGHSGISNVENMKVLAEKGVGLNDFINRKMKDRYARKIV